jgi:hypothetical protein
MMRVLKLDARDNQADMAGLVPAINALSRDVENVDARDEPRHDDADRLVT